jgi:hypothetical protein
MRRGMLDNVSLQGFLIMTIAPTHQKIDLKSVTLSKFDADWYKSLNSDPIFMISPFHEFISELMGKDLDGYHRLYRPHYDFYTKLWGKHAFEFQGRSLYKTWVFELATDEHLILLCADGKSTSYEYSGLHEPSESAANKAISILMTLKDELIKYKSQEYDLGM